MYSDKNIKSRISVVGFGENINARQLYELIECGSETGNFSYINSSSKSPYHDFNMAIQNSWRSSV